MWKSKCSLPTYPSHNLLCPSFRHPSNVTCSITQSITLCTCLAIGWWSFSTHIAQRCVFPLEARGQTPVSSRFLMAEFRQELFFSPPIQRPQPWSEVRGGWPGCQGGFLQRGKATGAHWTVHTADLLTWPWVWQAWEQRSRLHYPNQTKSKCSWMTGCIGYATTCSFKTKIKSRE